jgi:hypothetical protein
MLTMVALVLSTSFSGLVYLVRSASVIVSLAVFWTESMV